MGYPLPSNEQARLAALKRYQILDTDPELVYDDIVALAARLCDTPIALVSLLDETRQWFKARTGLDAQQTPRELAFCAHAIVSEETMIVEDAEHDARFAENPLVTSGPGIRFYAGSPLTDSDGNSLGTLCVIDIVPRKLTSEQQASLEGLRRVLVTLIEQRTLSHELAEALQHLKTLHGLLPICSYCKNVRNDEGYWGRIEEYLHEHVDADFTHSICPSCMSQQFPDISARMYGSS
jgi:GAF domain-containing protein